MKLFTVGLLGLLSVALCGASSCEEKAMAEYGLKIQKDPATGLYKVVEDPAHGQIGAIVQVAGDATSGIPIAGQVVGGLSLLSSLLYGILKRRAQAQADELNAQHEDTHTATALALQHFVNSQPHEVGKALVEHLDAVHDHMDVPAEHQDAIQPILKASA